MINLLFAVAVWLLPSVVRAEDLSVADKAYLFDRFGVEADDRLITDMTLAERAAIHQLIVDSWSQRYPSTRDGLIQGKLQQIHGRQCTAWALANPGFSCPPARNAEMQAGKVVADNRCNACHLFGTADAPPFFVLARGGSLTRSGLSAALTSGHRMSPITLTDGDLDALLRYIRGLK